MRMPADILMLVGALVAGALLIIVVRARHRSFRENASRLAEENVCEHLKPAMELLLSRGHRVLRVGQKAREMPMEIHLTPGFDPASLMNEMHLKEPVYLSERNVLYCKEDWCELHPVG